MKKWLLARFSGTFQWLVAAFGWTLLNLRGILGLASLIGLAVGCGMERLSLGLIVPSSIVLLMLTWSEIREIRREEGEKAAN